MLIRPARLEDAASISEVLRRSIRELCVADHRGDEAALEAWLANKTPDEVLRWLAMEDALILVAVDELGAVVAVGGVRRPDEIVLNYVSPEKRLRGISAAMLAALEGELRRGGARRFRLTSTRTAERFYGARGYAPAAASTSFGMNSLDMVKEDAG